MHYKVLSLSTFAATVLTFWVGFVLVLVLVGCFVSGGGGGGEGITLLLVPSFLFLARHQVFQLLPDGEIDL